VVFERVPGRDGGDGLGFPFGCSAGDGGALSRCRAELRGSECLLCCRVGNFPMPQEWDAGPGYNVVGARTVQAVHYARDSRSWAVVVLCGGRLVDGRFPPILCQSQERAIELAHLRARQIVPRVATKPWPKGEGHWIRGELQILVADPWS